MCATEEILKSGLTRLNQSVQYLHYVLDNKGTKVDFLNTLNAIEGECATIRDAVINHSRAWGHGLRTDGQPDRRFRANRDVT